MAQNAWNDALAFRVHNVEISAYNNTPTILVYASIKKGSVNADADSLVIEKVEEQKSGNVEVVSLRVVEKKAFYSESKPGNLLIRLVVDDGKYDGITRRLIFYFRYNRFSGHSEPYQYAFGSSINVLDVSHPVNIPWFSLLGVFFLLIALLFFIHGLPFIQFQKFKRDYVKLFSKYKLENGINTVVIDNYTTLPIEDDELVVTKCSHIMTLGSWIDNDDHCYEYPMRCEHGVSNYRRNGNFFQQSNNDRKLNYIWFGALAGLLAWIVFSLITTAFNTRFIAEFFHNELFYKRGTQISGTLAYQMLGGTSLSLFITLFISVIMEIRQAGQISYLRFLKRSLFFLTICLLLFPFFEWLRLEFLPILFWGHLIEWILSGALIGTLITLNTEVEFKNGLLSGVFAAVAAFVPYFFLPFLIVDTNYANFVSWICFGGGLGWFLILNTKRFDDYELIILRPTEFQGRSIVLNKWLRVRDINIGSHPSADVRIKWTDDSVAAQHAQLTYDGNVYIQAHGTEQVFINSRIISERTKLRHGDLIQLGISSNTMFRFAVKKSGAPILPAPQRNRIPSRPLVVSSTFSNPPPLSIAGSRLMDVLSSPSVPCIFPAIKNIEAYRLYNLPEIWTDTVVEQIFLSRNVAEQIFYTFRNQIKNNAPEPTGGFLLGQSIPANMGYALLFEQFIRVPFRENSGQYSGFGSEALAILDVNRHLFPHLQCVGWWLAKPRLEATLNDAERHVHLQYFKEPYQVFVQVTGGSKSIQWAAHSLRKNGQLNESGAKGWFEWSHSR